jgi:hypothetical protein
MGKAALKGENGVVFERNMVFHESPEEILARAHSLGPVIVRSAADPGADVGRGSFHLHALLTVFR